MPRPRLPLNELVKDFRDAREVNNVRQLKDKRDHIGVWHDEKANTLKITFREPLKKGGFQVFDVSDWLARPYLAIPFAKAIFSRFDERQPTTRYEAKQAVSAFFLFLPRYEQTRTTSVVYLNDIAQECIDDYLEYVDTRKAPAGTPLQLTTISNIRGPLRTVFLQLRSFEYEGYSLPSELDFPTLGMRGRKQSIQHVAPLDDITTIRVVIASIGEVEQIALSKPIHGFPVDDKGRILADLQLDEMLRRLDGLAKVEAKPLSMRDIVPFVLLLGLASSFNASTLVGAPQTAIHKSHPLYGLKRWQIQVTKYKAKHRVQKRSFAVEQYTWVNPVFLLAATEVYTRALRNLVAPEAANLLFLAVHRDGPSSLHTVDDGTKNAFDNALSKFCRDHDIQPFTLQRLRPTSSDVVHSITDGDVTAQHAALQHSRDDRNLAAETYTHVDAIWRDTERLAQAMLWRETYIKSRGKVDPRVAQGDVKRALRAATPGFACIDIFDSPYPGQQKGHPCTAYCMCPSCPMGAADVFDDVSVARLLQVEQKLIECKPIMHEERWMSDYKPQLEELRSTWFPLIRASVLKRAQAQSLPDIPDIE
ncbi:hypothetical protein B0G71_0720 [Paraburkholderia sp. BL27I4N3]|uniref:hypothetical protein n=1 Tax=Paraburkholderia sp. BL27I4N3 TaxID=1938805 RepID=UPI000E279746|nr:hypothetical protein [Paraburkholderia sp. BL27I4N3]REE17754.1 hypothetical protein B0G71_0720 [Paraburkholderia sp. BL27I4N3]